MAAVVSVAAIFVIHVAAAYPQEAEIIAQDSASGGYENAVSNEAAQLRDHQQLRRYFLSGSSSHAILRIHVAAPHRRANLSSFSQKHHFFTSI